MNEERKSDLADKSDVELKAELEKRTEEKWEKRGEEIEKKCDRFIDRLPRPVNALGDAICFTLLLAGIAWVVKLIGWKEGMPSFRLFGFIFLVIFAISLIYRFFIKPKCGRCCK